jgi:hypothetical protein
MSSHFNTKVCEPVSLYSWAPTCEVYKSTDMWEIWHDCMTCIWFDETETEEEKDKLDLIMLPQVWLPFYLDEMTKKIINFVCIDIWW